MSDPTLDSLKLLDDPARFRVVRNVPVFKPHVRKDKDGKVLYEVKGKDIPEIAQRTASLEQKSGVVGRLGQGHIKPGQPQKDQPKLFGYWRNAHEGTFGPSNESGVLVDYYVRVEDWDEFKDHPYRSAEFYPGRGTITGVACLKTDPELDLGVLVFETGEECYHYGMAEPVQYAAAVSPEDQEMQLLSRCLKKMFPHLERMHTEHAERYSATGPGTPCSTNAAVPKMSDDKKPVTLEQLQDQLATYERENTERAKQVGDLIALNKAQGDKITLLERQNVLVTYERDLEGLHRDYVFDLDEEMKLVADYTAEQFARHKTIMQRYERRPHTVPTVGPNGVPKPARKEGRLPTQKEQSDAISLATSEVEAGRLDPMHAYELAERALMLANDKGLTFEAALAEVKPQKR